MATYPCMHSQHGQATTEGSKEDRKGMRVLNWRVHISKA